MKRTLIQATIFITTLFLSLLLIRKLTPQLLDVPADLQIVKLDKRVPPFYTNIFKNSGISSAKFLINDPITIVRPKPLFPELSGLGPHDLLGFRNRMVPNVTDVITLGDSQTYGNNALLSENMPSHLQEFLKDKNASVYNISSGSWGAIQYLYMFTNIPVFQPRVVVVCFYTGNDAYETFKSAYSVDYWKELRVNKNLSIKDLPPIKFPPPDSETWTVKFQNNMTMAFSPHHRLISNDRSSAAIIEGLDIMAETVKAMLEISKHSGIKPVFTVIPTKELAYKNRLESEKIDPLEVMKKLFLDEEKNISELEAKIRSYGGTYVDLKTELQKAVTNGADLYPHDINGHFIPEGYKFVASSISKIVMDLLPEPLKGNVVVKINKDEYYYGIDGNVAKLLNDEAVAKIGRKNEVKEVSIRDIAKFEVKRDF